MKVSANTMSRRSNSVKLTTTRNRGTTPAKGPVITKRLADQYVMYVGNRIPVAAILGQVIGKPIPDGLDNKGFLLTHGTKPGVLIREVLFDEDRENYRYRDQELYGKVSALNSVKGKHFRAEILTQKELIALVKKANRVVTATSVQTDKRVKAALINKYGDAYIAGVTFDHSKLHVVNMESPAAHKQNKASLFVDFKDENESADKFISSHLR